MLNQRKKIRPKIKAQLQKEINSECPFCTNEDVGLFEIHHIDGNSSNSDNLGNLLMLCPTCHTKIEKNEISLTAVENKKKALVDRSWKVEFVSVTTDIAVCGWIASLENELAFFRSKSEGDANPILNFTFINHLSHTIVLSEINVVAKHLSRAISGIKKDKSAYPKVLKPLTKYYLQLQSNETNTLHLLNPIEVPPGRAFLFQIEIYPLSGRIATYFTFKFGNASYVKISSICFNCNDENERTQIAITGLDTPPVPSMTIRTFS